MAEVTEGGDIGRRLLADMEAMTWDRIGEHALANARDNQSRLGEGQSLARLRETGLGGGDSAIVVAAGPSVHRFNPAAEIVRAGYGGTVICTDSAIAYCLRNGLVPDLVVSLDPHATRIVRWFGDPSLSEASLAQDDYFRRQDMDDRFRDELRANQELMEMLAVHAPRISIALATSASKAVVDRVLQLGMKVYWWNPMLDDPDAPDSATRALQRLNGLPCVNAGGNVGSACWMMADAVLGKKHVALTGMDFGYYDDTPVERTQYYHESVALVGKDNLHRLFMRHYNPHVGAWFYTDLAYGWYREALLEMVQDADCVTYNCTQGGIVFGPGINFIPLAEFLGRHGS